MNISVQRPRVAVSRPSLPGNGIDLLAAHCEVSHWDSEVPPTPGELAELVRDCDGALVLGTDRIGPELLAVSDALQVVGLASMGFDAVDQAAAVGRGVVVTHTPGVLAETTADIAMALILMSRRRLGASVDVMRQGAWRTFRMHDFLGLDVHGTKLGLVGFGQIARALVPRP